MKLQEKNIAITLRKKGASYKEILKKIKVSKGTLSVWLRDIKLTPAQQHRLYFTLKQQNAYAMAKIRQKYKKVEIDRILSEAEKEFPIMATTQKNFIPGIMLYWAEGDKSKTQEGIKFGNSDPAMIKYMMRWFRDVCKVPEQKFRIAVHIHNLLYRSDALNYWSDITNIPTTQFNKIIIKQTTLGQRRNILYNGTCYIRISNKNLFRRISGWLNTFKKIHDLI